MTIASGNISSNNLLSLIHITLCGARVAIITGALVIKQGLT